MFTVVVMGLGVALWVWSPRLLASLLSGVEASDPLTFAGMVLLLLAVAAAAGLIPAARAGTLQGWRTTAGLPPEPYEPATSVTAR